MLGGLINTGAGLLQGILNRKTSRENTDKTIQANKEQAQYAFDQNRIDRNAQNAYNLDLWNKQNLYNSPESQMERYKEAGLNPNLIYGTGTTSAGNTGLAPKSETSKYQAPRQEYRYTPPQVGTALTRYQDATMKKAQIDNVQESTETQKLENLLRSGSISSQFQILKNQARQSGDTAELKSLELKERAWSYANNIQIDKWAAELIQTQAQAKTAQNKEAVSAWEKELSKEGMSINDPLIWRQGHKRGSEFWDKATDWWFNQGGGRTEFPNPWKKK